MAEISAWISAFLSILSIRARSTLRILPRMGRIACVCGLRASLAEPPAELPSTMKSSDSRGSREEQSASLPGRPAPSSADLRRVRSRAPCAASRARAACIDFWTIWLASRGFSSSHSVSFWFVVRSASERMEVLPSLDLVCPSNCGSRRRTEMMAVRPSRMSSPLRFSSFSFRRLRARA